MNTVRWERQLAALGPRSLVKTRHLGSWSEMERKIQGTEMAALETEVQSPPVKARDGGGRGREGGPEPWKDPHTHSC